MTSNSPQRTSAASARGRQVKNARPGHHTARGAKPKVQQSKSARIKRLRRKRIRNTILLVLLLAVLCAGAGFLVYTLKGGTFSSPLQPYQASREFVNTFTSGEDQRAKTFAADLCVVRKDVPLESATLEQGQKGLLLDLDNKKVLYSRGAYERVYPASITKIMTGMLALKYGNLDETVTISQENVTLEEGSQVCGFWAGDRVTMDQLVHCLLVYSGNDAAAAIAEHIAGSTSAFVDMMNSYAAELGCTGTNFTNPHGLQDENHYTTPYDIYLMLKEALNYPQFTEITQMPSYTVNYTREDGTPVTTTLEATDHYLIGEATAPKDVSILGGKTGTTNLAGNCLALLSQNAYGKPFVSIVMGASSKELLYQQMNSLLQNINN
ncbi:serine hydrolase [Blautia schinkii]|nr:serine hydrolase [Blautia schinkii]